MTPDGFERQMVRLISCYGKTAYPQARADLIFLELKSETDVTFERIVTKLIGERRTPPMMSEFREELAKVREQYVDQQKEIHRRENLALFELDGLAIHLYKATLAAPDSEERKAIRFWINLKGMAWTDAKIEKGKVEYQKQQAEMARRQA